MPASDLVAIVTNLAFANFFLKRHNQSTGWQLQVLMTSASEEERTCLAGNWWYFLYTCLSLYLLTRHLDGLLS